MRVILLDELLECESDKGEIAKKIKLKFSEHHLWMVPSQYRSSSSPRRYDGVEMASRMPPCTRIDGGWNSQPYGLIDGIRQGQNFRFGRPFPSPLTKIVM